MFHPIVESWFAARFGQPTEAQRRGWAEIAAGRNTLIMAPTGSGKTLAAFLSSIDRLVRRALSGELTSRVAVLYISPLRALSADVARNLQGPLAEIESAAIGAGRLMPPIRTALRTGDTTPAERAQQLKDPPHILITTPESLYLLLTSQSGRRALAHVETVIVDEIHALCGNKRGAHLALSLERLGELVGHPVHRIGLSATVEPPEEAAAFLVGYEQGKPRPCSLIDTGRARPFDLRVVTPEQELGAVASRALWREVYNHLLSEVIDHQTTLVFVPSRRLAERVAHDLEEHIGRDDLPEALKAKIPDQLRSPGWVAAHHGALSRGTRLDVERRLQVGELRVVVATSSLELGIDIGAIDVVCQIGSPRSVAVLRQRVGRAGHTVGGTPKARLYAMVRDDLIECAAAVRALRQGVVDRPLVQPAPLDILAQQLVAHAAATETGVSLTDTFAMVRRAGPYQALSRCQFDDVVAMLADGISTRRGRSGAHLHWDRVNGRLRARRGAKLAAITSGGAIPDIFDYQVVEVGSEAVVGTVGEDFAIDSTPGSVFLLGSTSWKIEQVQQSRVLVHNAHGAAPNIPFWNGEGLARTEELSIAVSDLRLQIWDRVAAGLPKDELVRWLCEESATTAHAAEQAIKYIAEGQAALGVIPSRDVLVAERFFDDGGGMQLLIHAPFGARLNRAYSLALRKRFCRNFDFELQSVATDDAILLSLGAQHSFPLETIFRFVHPDKARHLVEQAAIQTPIWENRWRWNATRALAVLRFTKGKKTPPLLQRMRANDLSAAVFPAQAGCQDNHGGEDLEIPDHPLVHETIRDCCNEATDTAGFEALLRQVFEGKVACIARDTIAPSPFAGGVLAANPYAYMDDAPLEERRARAVSTRAAADILDANLVDLDATAVAQVVAEAEPEVRSTDELHDLLYTAVLLPPPAGRPELATYYDELRAEGRVESLSVDGCALWYAIERRSLVAALYPDRGLSLFGDAVDAEEACRLLLLGTLSMSGPIRAAELAARFGLAEWQIEAALARLEGDGQVVRGAFALAGGELRWCDRALLQRIHRRTLERLRSQIAPVSLALYREFLARWQHAAPGTAVEGIEGVVKVLDQLDGCELRAVTWEREVLARRVKDYQPAWLDQLCLSGEYGWARLLPSSRPRQSTALRQRALQGSIAIFRRDSASIWWKLPVPTLPLSELGQRVLERLEQRGAAFAADLASTLGAPLGDITAALWELCRAGLVASDGFAGLRLLLGNESAANLRACGRWSILPRQRESVPPSNDELHQLCRILLRRYGVVWKGLVQRETTMPVWYLLQGMFRRLEARGEVRGGRFVAEVSGEQYALPEAVDGLRALRKLVVLPTEIALPSSDPAYVAPPVAASAPPVAASGSLHERVDHRGSDQGL